MDWEELEEATNASEVAIKTMNYKEITVIKIPKGEFRFPLAEGVLNHLAIRSKERTQRARKQKITKEDKATLEESLEFEPSTLVESSEGEDETATDEEWEDGTLFDVDKEVVLYRDRQIAAESGDEESTANSRSTHRATETDDGSKTLGS